MPAPRRPLLPILALIAVCAVATAAVATHAPATPWTPAGAPAQDAVGPAADTQSRARSRAATLSTSRVVTLAAAELRAGRVALDGPWRFHAGDHPAGADPALDERAWPLVPAALDGEHRLRPGGLEPPRRGGPDVVWLRQRIAVDEAFRGVPLWLHLRGNAGAAEVYLDGRRILTLGQVDAGREGGGLAGRAATRAAANTAADPARAVVRGLAPVEITLDGEHVLAVRYSLASAEAVAERFGADGLGFAAAIGVPDMGSGVVWSGLQFRTGLVLFLVGVLLAFGTVHLTLFSFHARPRTNLWFALTAFACALLAYSMHVRDTAVWLVHHHQAARVVAGVALPLALLAVGRLVYAVFYDRLPRHFWALAALALVPAPLVALAPAAHRVVFPPSLLVGALLLVAVVAGAVRRRREGAWVVGIGVLGVATMAILFEVLPALGLAVDPMLARFRPFFGVLWLVLGMSIYLARSYARTSHGFERLTEELEEANRTLEERVAERTARLGASERKFRGLVERSNDAILVVDAMELDLLDANPAAERLFGIDRNGLRRLRFPDLCPPGEFERYLPIFRAHIETGAPIVEDIFIQDLTGRPIPVGISGSIAEMDGRTVIQATIHDLTDRVRVQDALRQARDAAESANRAKSQFMANMSHELRTPLNAIIGYSEMLMEEAEEAGQQQQYGADLARITTSGKHLLGLINQVLDLSRVEAGRMELHLEDCAIAGLVADVAGSVRPLLEKNRNTLTVDGLDDAGAVHADAAKLRQILLNLVGNAAKFTEDGRIDLAVRQLPAGTSGDAGDGQDSGAGSDDAAAPGPAAPGDVAPDHVEFRVTDTGIGMTEAQLARLFQPFSQADPEVTVRYGGTGLGLAISKHFAEMMGGRIAVASAPGLGSTFTLTLPARVVPPAAAAAPAAAPAAPDAHQPG
jgi:PAS domain S-box-containing protein